MTSSSSDGQDREMVVPLNLRAAQYLRMSTDMQQYSLQNQSLAIAAYAARRGLSIVRSYEDAGKSGVTATQRDGLQALITDVRAGVADFKTVLVLDVSRWGRFQDSDESAYYEFLCREAGVKVEYCVELFENDGSLAATVLKNIKRAMAGEFSRELSAKVFAGQARSVARGNFVGSKPGFGLRRCIVNERGHRVAELGPGQRKAISSYRTILVPGPPEEIALIEDVYAMFLEQDFSLERIAAALNDRGAVNAEGRRWSGLAVRQLLGNEKYIGTAVFARTSKKINVGFRKNARSDWVRVPQAFEPIVSLDQFAKAKERLARNARGYSTNELLDSLTATWCSVGRLSAGTIELAAKSPCVNAYKEHFGSLVDAYRVIGYRGRYGAGNYPDIRRLTTVLAINRLRIMGRAVEQHRTGSAFTVDNELQIEVMTSKSDPSCGKCTWHMGRRAWKPDILVVVRVDGRTSQVREYLLVPALLLGSTTWLTVSTLRNNRLQSFRYPNLEPLFRLCEREDISNGEQTRIGQGKITHALRAGAAGGPERD